MNKVAKLFLPPIITRLLEGKPELPQEFETYQEAEKSAGSYSDDKIVKAVSESTSVFCSELDVKNGASSQEIGQLLYSIEHAHKKTPLSILELGGACGALFFELDQFMPGKIERWDILETPTMAVEGKKNFATERLSFHDNLTSVQDVDYDLLIARGVYQYLPNPLETFTKILNIKADRVYISRTMVTSDESTLISYQEAPLSNHGPARIQDMNAETARHIITLVGERAFFDLLEDQGYEKETVFHCCPTAAFQTQRRSYPLREIALLARNRR